MDEALKGQYQTPTLSFKTAEDMQTHFNPAQELWKLNLSEPPIRARSKSWKLHGVTEDDWNLTGVDKLCFRGIKKLIMKAQILKPILFVI